LGEGINRVIQGSHRTCDEAPPDAEAGSRRSRMPQFGHVGMFRSAVVS